MAREHWYQIRTLVAKDWLLFWNDRRAALLCFLVPIVLASAFGMIFHRPEHDDALRLPLLLVNGTNSEFTNHLIQDLLQSSRVEAEEVTLAEAERRVRDHRPGIALVFPPEFAAIEQWEPGRRNRPPLRILHHPLSTAESQWAEGVVTEAILRRLAKEKYGPLALSFMEPPFQAEMLPVTGDTPQSFNSYSHSFCGMSLQYLLFWGMESGLLFLRERQRGVWLRLRAGPASLGTMILSKAISTAMIALLQVLVTFSFGYLVFGVRVTGSLTGFVLVALAACCLAAATGLLVAAIGGSESRARNVSILVILGVSMIGGLWLPDFLLPGWVRDCSLLLPTTWIMHGLAAMTWQGSGLMHVLPGVAVVLGFTGVFLAVATLRLWFQESRLRRGVES